MLLKGRVALVTGASRGIGRAIAQGMAREGADLVLAARTQEALESLAHEVESQGRQALVVPTDVTAPEQVRALVRQARERFGRLDILVNSTGVIDNVPIAGHSEEVWHRIMGVNL
ncbi:MAG: SDR family NAD(P)-dependent oxidoreductase, partial [Dehalococcoidia bacterium]